MSRYAVLVLASLALSSCGADETLIEFDPLVVASGWRAAELSQDRLSGHQPEQVFCPDSGWREEDGSLEVNTGQCNYLSVEQKLMVGAVRGEMIVVNLWHQPLHADSLGRAHVALLLSDGVLWEREAVIPGPGAVWRDELPAPRDLRAGESLVFHLHNHGANSWNLGDVVLSRGKR
ncbi:MAG: hypothetical protein AAFQ82_07360 [Myxococcota bacterium]